MGSMRLQIPLGLLCGHAGSELEYWGASLSAAVVGMHMCGPRPAHIL